MRRPRGDGHIVTRFCVHAVRLGVIDKASRGEAELTVRDEEGLVVHFVPVRWGAVRVRREGEFGGPKTVIYHFGNGRDAGLIRLRAFFFSLFSLM